MDKGAQEPDEHWVQRLIASALCLGIGKRELMQDYYLDEIGLIFEAWGDLHSTDSDKDEDMSDDPLAFFGEEGEIIG